MKKLTILVAAAVAFALGSVSHASDTSIKLYALDCGTINMFDIAPFSGEGHFENKPATLADPCFLVRHPKGDFLWDAGLGDAIADMPEGKTEPWGHLTVKRKLSAQLKDLGLTPGDIDYLSLSHWHPDHSGNANLFAGATFIAQKNEHAFMFSDTMRAATDAFGVYSKLETANTVQFGDAHDVFGDGSVVIHAALGHTPGHSILKLELENTGTVMFSGDLYIFEQSRTLGAVPSFNVDMAATKISQAAFEATAKAHSARVVIQHDMDHFKSLPAFPAFLD